ncbi:MAG: hypothetical protein QXV09_06320, partial [Candidatus Bathyarchaeia archaeon]
KNVISRFQRLCFPLTQTNQLSGAKETSKTKKKRADLAVSKDRAASAQASAENRYGSGVAWL